MKTLKIEWLGKCPNCKNTKHQVTTEDGNCNWLYDFDKVECLCCEIEADGEAAWVVWGEVKK